MRTSLHTISSSSHFNLFPRTKYTYNKLFTLSPTVQLLHTMKLHKLSIALTNHRKLHLHASLYCTHWHFSILLLHKITTPLSWSGCILSFYISRTNGNKEWTIYSYLGDSQCVLVALLVICTVSHLPMRVSFALYPEGWLKVILIDNN